MGQMTPFEGRAATKARYVDESSFSDLMEALSDLRDYYKLERDPGRASWLSEIVEDFGKTIARLEPSLERTTLM